MRIRGTDRTWMMLVVLALVAAGAYYLLELRGANEPDSAQADYVWELEVGEISGVRVEDHASGAAMAVELDGAGGWRVTEPLTGTASAEECEFLTYSLAQLQVQRRIEQPPAEELAAYGLITPTYVIEVDVSGGRTLQLDIGARHPSGSYYARFPGAGDVVMVAEYVVQGLIALIEEPPLLGGLPTPTAEPPAELEPAE
jgi:hypothetical protein